MDNSSTLIGLGLLFLFIGPIVFLIYSQKQKYSRLSKLLNINSDEFNLKPDIIDLTPTLVLGLDSTLKKLLYIIPANQQAILIPLQEIAACELKTIDIKDLPGKINFINVVLNHKKRENPPVEIIFYNEEDDANPEAEVQLQLAKKWERIIRRHLIV